MAARPFIEFAVIVIQLDFPAIDGAMILLNTFLQSQRGSNLSQRSCSWFPSRFLLKKEKNGVSEGNVFVGKIFSSKNINTTTRDLL